ncbi:MAG: oxidoreductase [Candidatus Korarchaeum sp.]
MPKAKIAFYWCASCGGCEEAQVDLAEKIFDLVEAADIVLWPVAMDFKKEDVEKIPDGSVDVAIINGGIRVSEHEEMVELLRRKAKLVVAYGSCAHMGGIPALANAYTKESILKYVYEEAPTAANPSSRRPEARVTVDGMEFELPAFLEYLKPLDEVVEVDYYIPGCPPTPEITWEAISSILSGKLPPKGHVFGSDRALCYECPLNETKPEKIVLDSIKRPHQVILDPSKCYLIQGVLCMGPVTRGGCKALCVRGNMPCTGCFGPVDGVSYQGAKALSFFSSIINVDDEVAFRKLLDEVGVDPLGWFAKYCFGKGTIYRRSGD